MLPPPKACEGMNSLHRSSSRSGPGLKETNLEKFVQKGAIRFDVDGNLLGRGETLDKYPEVREALAYLLQRGVRVVILSGNSYTTLEERVVAPLRRALRRRHAGPLAIDRLRERFDSEMPI